MLVSVERIFEDPGFELRRCSPFRCSFGWETAGRCYLLTWQMEKQELRRRTAQCKTSLSSCAGVQSDGAECAWLLQLQLHQPSKARARPLPWKAASTLSLPGLILWLLTRGDLAARGTCGNVCKQFGLLCLRGRGR